MSDNIQKAFEHIGSKLRMEDIHQAAWILFRKELDSLNRDERFGLYFFGILSHMGYQETWSSFVVNKSLEWGLKELKKKRPAIVQILDQRFLTFFSEPKDGFHAWDISKMRAAEYRDMPEQPLISIAISLARLEVEAVRNNIISEEGKE